MNPVIENPYATAPAGAVDADNPYLGAHASSSPDLDAAAPSLRQAEQQRVNRKAIAFLGGIIGLLMLMGVLVLRGTGPRGDAPKPVEERVSIPSLGDAPTPVPTQASATVPASAQPIEVEPSTQDLPPLPPSRPYADVPPPPPGYGPPGYGAPEARRPPTLLERRMGMDAPPAPAAGPQGAYAQALALSQAAITGRAPPSTDGESSANDAGRSRATRARALRNPDALLVRGSMLRCALETRVVSDIPGYTSCVLTEPVYSINGRSLLLERGSKIYGSYERGPTGDRMAVVWDRITTPGGVDVEMSSPGVDNLGGAGHPGHRDAHWPERIGAALMVSLLSDAFKYAAAENGPSTATVSQGVVVVSPYESNTARTLDRLANQAVQEALSRAPTVTINQGTVVNVYVARDVDFSEVLGR